MAHSFQIGDFILVPSLNQLHHVDQVYTLEPKVIDLLLFFAHQPNIIASREDIRSAIWGSIAVSDHAINRLISQLRKALCDNKQPYQYIETVAKRGYRLVAKVSLRQEKPLTKSIKPLKNKRAVLFGLIAAIVMLCFLLFKDPLNNKERSFKINGGTIKQISAMPGREWQPKYSSNGQWLTFLHFDKVTMKYHIMLKSDQQTSATLAFTTDKQITDYYWLPQQDRLLIATFDGKNCAIEQLEFAVQHGQLVKTPLSIPCGQHSTRAVTWSPIDEKLYWITNQGELYRQKLNSQSLALSIQENSLVEKVLAVENIYQFSLSLTGEFLALLTHDKWERSDIDVYNIKNNSLKTLKIGEKLIHAISWNNAREELLFVEENEVNTIDMNGTVTKAGFNSESDIYNMSYSDEKSQLLYAATNAKYQLVQLTKDVNGGYRKHSPQWGSQVNERNPVYSHDGKSIAFISQRSGQYGIAIKTGSGEIRQLELHGLDLSQTLIRWSPDDKSLLFHSKNSLFVYSLATDEYQQLTEDNIYADVTAWSYREPENIYFRSDVDGQMNIWLINIGTGNIKKITENGGFSGHESQDGKYFYFTKELDDGLWRLDLTTQEKILFIKGFSRKNELSWYLTPQGIYYLYSNQQKPSVYYYSFSHKTEQLLWSYGAWLHGGFTVSPDQNHIYLGLKEQIEWNIMSINTQ